MGSRHVTDLLGDHLDGGLDDVTRRRVEGHVMECAACATSLADMTLAATALRALPPAPMPVPVRLPASPPVAVRSGWRDALGEVAATHRRALATGLGTAAAAAAVVVVAVTGLHHGSSGSPASAPTSAEGQAGAAGDVAPKLNGGGSLAAPGLAAPAPAVAGYPYSVTASVPGHPGETVTLSAPSARVLPGQTLLVRVSVGGGASVADPGSPPSTAGSALGLASASAVQVRLVAGAGVTGSGTASPASSGAGAPGRPSTLSIAAARATASADGVPTLAFDVPATLTAGEPVEVVALLPDGSGGDTVVVVLSLTLG